MFGMCAPNITVIFHDARSVSFASIKHWLFVIFYTTQTCIYCCGTGHLWKAHLSSTGVQLMHQRWHNNIPTMFLQTMISQLSLDAKLRQ